MENWSWSRPWRRANATDREKNVRFNGPQEKKKNTRPRKIAPGEGRRGIKKGTGVSFGVSRRERVCRIASIIALRLILKEKGRNKWDTMKRESRRDAKGKN